MTIQPAIITKVNDNKPGITLEQYSQLPLDSSVNPNVKLKDVFNPTQLDFLYYYDQASDEDLAAYDQNESSFKLTKTIASISITSTAYSC